MAKRKFAIYDRDGECLHHEPVWSGRIPNTGTYRCRLCGEEIDPNTRLPLGEEPIIPLAKLVDMDFDERDVGFEMTTPKYIMVTERNISRDVEIQNEKIVVKLDIDLAPESMIREMVRFVRQFSIDYVQHLGSGSFFRYRHYIDNELKNEEVYRLVSGKLIRSKDELYLSGIVE